MTNSNRTLLQFFDTADLTELRIKQACTMLVNGNYSIEKIAEYVGYNSVVAFRRAFKAYTGINPKEYKQRQNNFS